MNTKSLMLSGTISIAFVFFCIYWSGNILIQSDTLEYYHAFNNIDNRPLIWFPEIFTSLSMWVLYKLGASFNGYLLFNNLLWLPVISWTSYKSRKDLFFIFIILFFFTHLFFINNSFLIRQFQGFLFFCMFYLSQGKKSKILYAMLAVLSHLSMILLLLFITRSLSSFVIKNKIPILIVFIIVIFLDPYKYVIIIFEYLYSLSSLGVFNAKLIASKNYLEDFIEKPNLYIIIGNYFIIILIAFNRKISPVNHEFYGLVLISSILLILLKDQIVLANRVGFVSYYFFIPCLILSIRSYFVK